MSWIYGRRTRRKKSAEEKDRIVLEGFKGEDSLSLIFHEDRQKRKKIKW